METKIGHTTIRNQNLFCLNCGGQYNLIYPIALDEMTKKMDAFTELHKNCEKTWEPPTIDQNRPLSDKMDFWLAHGERGISSEVMFQKFSYQDLGRTEPSHPLDPDDFRRCHIMLETISEWKNRLDELKSLSPIWERLVDNWDRLTDMLIEQIATGKDNGMYELMKKIGC